MELNKLNTIARAVEAALSGFGCFGYIEHEGAYHIMLNDYHAIENIADMVKVLDKNIKVSEGEYDEDIHDAFAYIAVLEL